MSTKTKARELHILSKKVKGKTQFFIVAYEYLSNPKKKVNYPEFKPGFDKRSDAKTRALEVAKKIELRTSVQFVTRFL